MIIFDEVDYAEAILRNGCSKRNVLLDFNILAKYYMYYIGLSEQGTREKMLDVLKNSEIYIPISYLIPKIDKAISYAQNDKLKTMDAVIVYQEELDEIDKLPEEVKDLAFEYLFLSKWSQNEKGFYLSQADAKKLLGNASMRNDKLQMLNYILEKEGFIKFVDTKTKELIKVLKKKDNGTKVIEVEDFYHPTLYYRRYLGEKIINCEICNCLVKPRSNKQKYCKDCAKTQKLKQTMKSKRKSVLEENRN
jgi:hypothetical protein